MNQPLTPLQDYFMQVFTWMTNPAAWLGIGPIWQMIGIVLLVLTILQALPDSVATGWLFQRKGLWITLILDAAYLLLVFTSPFVPGFVTIIYLIASLLIVAAIFARNWK